MDPGSLRQLLYGCTPVPSAERSWLFGRVDSNLVNNRRALGGCAGRPLDQCPSGGQGKRRGRELPHGRVLLCELKAELCGVLDIFLAGFCLPSKVSKDPGHACQRFCGACRRSRSSEGYRAVGRFSGWTLKSVRQSSKSPLCRNILQSDDSLSSIQQIAPVPERLSLRSRIRKWC